MDAGRERRALALFDAAFERDEYERGAWAAAQCGDDDELRAAVQALLDADAKLSGTLPTVVPAGRPAFTGRASPPDRVGVYRVGAKLGGGGMGDVYLAERDDGLFERKVAVKLMAPGLFAAAAAALFDNERRLLARLRHPHIATLLDGGIASEGVPYLVMELVEGVPIDRWCFDQKLPVRETVRLFLDVCAAVRHAHQQLVVHADLKPSNILVDREGQVKLLDFGIARLVHANSAEGVTPGFPLPLTPAYASPRRRAGDLPTPADDVYALGVVLFELLAGDRPSERADATERPSTAIRTAETWTQMGVAAAWRLGRVRDVAGDLDAIVARARADGAADRYSSVDALADDLHRWLESKPVVARGGGWRYVAGRFVARHRAGVAVGVAALVSLVLGLVVTASLYVRAEKARAEAERRYADVRSLSRYLMLDLNDRLASLPHSLAIRRDLAATGQRYLDGLAVDGTAPEPLVLETIEGLTRLAAIEGGRGQANLGRATQAQANLHKAASLLERLSAATRGSVRAKMLEGEIEADLAALDMDVFNRFDEAAARLSRADAAYFAADQMAPGDPAIATARVRRDLLESTLLQWQGHYADATALAESVASKVRALPDPAIAPRDRALLLARAFDAAAESTYYGGSAQGAEAPYREEVEVLAQAKAAHPGDAALSAMHARGLWALGTTLIELQRPGEALPALEESEREASLLAAQEPEDEDLQSVAAVTALAYGEGLAANRRFDEAFPILEGAVDRRRQAWKRAPDDWSKARQYAVAVAALADAQADAGKITQACANYAEAKPTFVAIARLRQLPAEETDYSLRLVEERSSKICPKKMGPGKIGSE